MSDFLTDNYVLPKRAALDKLVVHLLRRSLYELTIWASGCGFGVTAAGSKRRGGLIIVSTISIYWWHTRALC
jgi:hypothetical protein